jgi:hypothetical protein
MQMRPNVYLFLESLYEKFFRVLSLYVSRNSVDDVYQNQVLLMQTYGANSPSLCPTMSSVIVISSYFLPLCTWNFRPTKFGRIVAERACVLIGACRSPAFARTMGRLWTFSGLWAKVRVMAYGRMLGPVGTISYVLLIWKALQLTFPDGSRAKRPCGKHCDVLP